MKAWPRMNRKFLSGLSAAIMSLQRAVCAREMVSLADMVSGGERLLRVGLDGCIRLGNWMVQSDFGRSCCTCVGILSMTRGSFEVSGSYRGYRQ